MWGKATLLVLMVILTSGCGNEAGSADVAGTEGTQLSTVESDLLSLINSERTASGLPTLVRDAGLDRIMLWYGQDMQSGHHVGHTDTNSRDAEGRVQFYSGDDSVRCSEITQWRSGQLGQDHYDAYKADANNQSAYLEQGAFDLGPTDDVGVIAISGKGPTGSGFESTDGSYTGVLLCDQGVTLTIDPFSQ